MSEGKPKRLDLLAGPRIYDPREFLRGIWSLLAKVRDADWNMPPEELKRYVTLRVGALKKTRELCDACIFACLFEQVLGPLLGEPNLRFQVIPALDESSDTDAYAFWKDREDKNQFIPLQMKELPPLSLNPTSTLDAELLKLKKYPPSKEPPLVAFKLNRDGPIGAFSVPSGLNVAGLWLFGTLDREASRRALIGDLTRDGHQRYELPMVL